MGGLVFLVTDYFKFPYVVQFSLTLGVVIAIRLVAVKYKLELPKIKDDLFGK